MNKADSEKIAGILFGLGYEERTTPEEATLLIMNTCSIRAASENKAYSYLGLWKKLKQKNPEVKIAMCGCVAEQTKEKVFVKAPQVDFILGTKNIHELPKFLNQDTTENFKPARKKGISAWLPIIEGCDYFCTYCVVPYTRGRQRSRLPEEIIKEAKEIAQEGFKEITLLGQTVDSYGNDIDDKNINLPNLLRELNNIEDLYRIRFVTSHPTDITDELIYTVRDLDKVCEYFHIPMQSGNNEVLKRMRRPYTREHYLELVNKIKSEIPDVAITSDFIAGFPGETEEQFQDTLSIIDEVVFDHCNTAAYSPRRQTPAAVWKDQLPLEEKKRRLNLLNDKVKEACKKSNEKYVGRTLEVLEDRTRNNKIVHFEGGEGLINHVKITEASIWCLKGELSQ